MVLLAPLMDTEPGPPDRCVNVPAPPVAKFPATLRLVLLAAVVPAPLMVRLLKLLAPAPLMSAAAPVKVTEPVPPV